MRATRKALVAAYLERTGAAAVGEREWNELLELAPERPLRTALREIGIPVEQPYAGIRQTNFDELERTLLEMLKAYRNGGGDMQRKCRGVVIQAKDHARLASRRSEARRALKEEMVEWMLVWLGDPEMFPSWAKLRRARLLQSDLHSLHR